LSDERYFDLRFLEASYFALHARTDQNEISLVDQNRLTRSSILFENEISSSHRVGSVCSSCLSSIGERRLHSRSTLLFFSRRGSLQDRRYGKYFRCEAFFSGFPRVEMVYTRDVSYTYFPYFVKGILRGFGAKDLLDSPLE